MIAEERHPSSCRLDIPRRCAGSNRLSVKIGIVFKRTVTRRLRGAISQNEGPGESCKDKLAKLATARAMVSARLPLLRIGTFQIE